MPCPFPGMDPYLEMPPFWSDFSPTLLGEIRNALLPKVLPLYDVRIEEYLFVTREDIRLHRVQPDVTVSTTTAWQPGMEATVAVAEPTMVELEYPAMEPTMQRRLRLIHRPTGRVVTVMELLSPINKAVGRRRAGGVPGEASGVPCQRLSFDRVRLAARRRASADGGAAAERRLLRLRGPRRPAAARPGPGLAAPLALADGARTAPAGRPGRAAGSAICFPRRPTNHPSTTAACRTSSRCCRPCHRRTKLGSASDYSKATCRRVPRPE